MITSGAPTPPLKAAVVGLGRMGLRHLEAMRGLELKVQGLADLDAAVASAAAEAAGLPPEAVFNDAFEMFATVRPEAVTIATTAPSHAPLVLAAVQAGARYVLCEKPMAVSLEEAELMKQACSRAGAILAVNHQMRFMPNYTRVRELIGTPELGPLVSMVVAGSNFGLAMNASHYFEAFRWLTGTSVDTIAAEFETERLNNPRGPAFEDRSGRLMATGTGGEGLYIDFSSRAGWGLQVTYICRNGQIVLDELNGDLRIAARCAEFREMPTSRYGLPVEIRTESIPPAETVESTRAVWRAMLAGGGYPDAEVGEHALACLAAAHLSDRMGGQRVPVEHSAAIRGERFAWA